MKFLTALIFLHLVLFCSYAFGQETPIDQKLSIIQNQVEILKTQLAENSTEDLHKQIEELKKQIPNQDGIELKNKIDSLQSELASKEKVIAELQQSITGLTTQISTIVNSLSAQSTERQKAEKIAQDAEIAKNDLLKESITNFKNFVLAWYDLGALLSASAGTSKAMLIFPNAKSEHIWQTVTKYAGITGGIVGPLMYSSSTDPSLQKKGVITTGISLSVTGLISQVFKNKDSQTIIENIGRNVVFNDEVKSFDQLSFQFKTKSKALYDSIKPIQDITNWRPSSQNLKEYYALISLRRDLTVAVRQMKAKCEFLLTLAVTDEGKNELNGLIIKYDGALESWESSETVYLSTYNYLYQIIVSGK